MILAAAVATVATSAPSYIQSLYSKIQYHNYKVVVVSLSNYHAAGVLFAALFLSDTPGSTSWNLDVTF